jgi:hypothetical protein
LLNGIKSVAYRAAPPGCGGDAVARNERSAGPCPRPRLLRLRRRGRTEAGRLRKRSPHAVSQVPARRSGRDQVLSPGWSPLGDQSFRKLVPLRIPDAGDRPSVTHLTRL